MATKLYSAEWVAETISRLADQVRADRMPGTGLAIVGLQTRGAVLARRMGAELKAGGVEVRVGELDATLYRDDLDSGSGLKPIKGSDMNFNLRDLGVVLVDDVMCTGRTIRAAMDAIFAYGRPACIRLCVMLDRGGRELPIQADFVGAHVEVPQGGFVRLKLAEIDPHGDAVFVVGPGDEEP